MSDGEPASFSIRLPGWNPIEPGWNPIELEVLLVISATYYSTRVDTRVDTRMDGAIGGQ